LEELGADVGWWLVDEFFFVFNARLYFFLCPLFLKLEDERQQNMTKF
jgi:hypothetical protein